MDTLKIRYKMAEESHEFEQIHQLNYRTFVEEIPQHSSNAGRRLVDRFHLENRYFIALDDDQVVGMIALRANRPFSLDGKIPGLEQYLPETTGQSLCEIRLLAIDPAYRHSRIFARLFGLTLEYSLSQQYTMAVVSATILQKKLYANLGFQPFAYLVGTARALYQPMYLELNAALEMRTRLQSARVWPSHVSQQVALATVSSEPISFMPGPVQIHPSVQEVFAGAPISHRSERFQQILDATKLKIMRLVKVDNVEIFLGSGTLGNDVVAAQISRLKAPGLILSNGEFGQRLCDHAERFGLIFSKHTVPFGHSFDLLDLRACLQRERPTWLWMTHCETSSGILNSLSEILSLCNEFSVKLCVDCTSSVACVEVDLSGVYLASTVSGKALAAYPGLAIVCYSHEVTPDSSLPRYLDLGYYRACSGVPYTHSYNLVAALHQALKRLNIERRIIDIQSDSHYLRAALEKENIHCINAPHQSSPAVLSIQIGVGISSLACGQAMEKAGFLLSYRSAYLIQSNLLQICLMGETNRAQLQTMLRCLTAWMNEQTSMQHVEIASA
ncbi:MAG: aminotransferase class V-fold PLP-dependent enzyme [Undibacterium sp.]|nr:aminotransferase class V-fold PLP-dependent enzyme [Undibacterium sp.]